MPDKDYIAIVQCYIVKERCSEYFCERAFHPLRLGLDMVEGTWISDEAESRRKAGVYQSGPIIASP